MLRLPVAVAANPLCGVAVPVVAAGNDGVELVADGADDVVHVLVPPLASTSPHTLAPGLPTPASLGHLPGVLVHLAVVYGLA